MEASAASRIAIRALAFCSVIAIALGCVPPCQVRYTGDNRDQLTIRAVTTNCAANGDLHQQSIERYDGFSFATIEFTDDGHSKAYDQVRQARDLLNEKDTDAGALIVVFVHGWHHNADPFDDNMRCFRTVIERLHTIRYKHHDSRPVVGLFVAWRGDSIASPWINWATFWNRKGASETIGKLGARDFLSELADRYEHDRSVLNRRTTVVFVGHSFGADLIFSALEYRLLGGADNRVQVMPPRVRGAAVKPARAGLGELAILVNPAVEASRYRPFDADLDAPGEYRPNQSPRLVVIASHADGAVGIAFPFGQSLWMLFHPDYVGCGAPCLIGLGHFQPQITHHLDCAGKQARVKGISAKCACSALDPGASFGGADFKVDGFEKQSVGPGLTLTPVPGKARKHSPFLVIETNRNVIAGHSDIFNSRIMDFIVNYVQNLPPPAQYAE